MPGAYVYKTENRQYDYVRDVYSTIIIRDLVEKYKIRNKLGVHQHIRIYDG